MKIKTPMFFYEGDAGGASGGAASTTTTLVSGATDATAATGAAASAAAPEWSWAKPDGAFNDGWRDKLPDGLGANPSLAVIGSVGDLAKSYVATKGLIGTKLEMPGEGATPEAIASWRKIVGTPETPEGYLGDAKSLRPDFVPENLWNPEGEKAFLALAHKHHLPPAAVKDILNFHAGATKAALDASQATEGDTLKAEGAKLKQEWGKEYDSNLNIASRMAATVGLDPKTHPFFTTAEGVQVFAKMGKLLSEDKLVKGESAGISGAVSDRIREITDPSSTSPLARDYRNDNGPERQAAAQKILHDLYNAQQQAA